MSSTFDSDEALARYLQEQENIQSNDIYQADLELARQLQNESSVIDLTDAIDLTPDNEDNDYNTNYYETKQNNDNNSLLLASKLQEQETENDRLLAEQLEHTTMDESILNDETPDIHQLFMYFNNTYFNEQLGSVQVKWSTKMTRCAGTCTYKGLGNCIIALSEPILKFRPKKDLFETLLHEMIHALLFLTQNNTDRDGHGPEFLKEAKRISDVANVKITVYHNFHDEVNHYLVHVWQCNGPCQHRPPYFGIVRRSMNRPPQPADTWYAEHQLTCGGTYTKISGPPPKEKKKKRPSNTLDHYFDSVDEKMKKLKEV